jgi:hypothetical protein
MDEDGVREVDLANRNGARARKQAAQSAGVIEDADGNVHRLTATALVIPEEKRCVAMTVRGERCKAGRMRGLQVCTFHSHLALADETLREIVGDGKPRLTPRKALQAVVALRAEELAQAAVGGALDAGGSRSTSAVLALVDAVDPLVSEQATLSFTAEGVERASYVQLRARYGPGRAEPEPA